MRASRPRFNRSCNGAIASAARDDHAKPIRAGPGPIRPAITLIEILARHDLLLTLGKLLEPLAACGVIVRAGVDDGVIDEVLRKVRIVFIPIEGELQNPRAWNLELVAKGFHIRSDQAEIFRDERQSA